MLAGDDNRSAMTEAVVASQVLFFFRADRSWCEAHVLPLFDWADLPRARRAWDGYLIWGRWDDQLLSAGLLNEYLGAAEHLETLRNELRGRLYSHLAGIAATSELNPLAWIQKFTSVLFLMICVSHETWHDAFRWTAVLA